VGRVRRAGAAVGTLLRARQPAGGRGRRRDPRAGRGELSAPARARPHRCRPDGRRDGGHSPVAGEITAHSCRRLHTWSTRPHPAPRRAPPPEDPVSTDQLTETSHEPAAPSPVTVAARAVATAARRLPVTAVIVAALLVTGVALEA